MACNMQGKHYSLYSIPDDYMLEWGYGSAEGAFETRSGYANSHQIVVVAWKGKKYLGQVDRWGKITNNPKVWKSKIVNSARKVGH